ncbi:MAG: peptidylprolyl isomerase [Chloroflexi bacterium]|jgi:FKBP-type peptidyl-prolyl cis-trans isomerase 2|nr:peptidylprolyl isomerase [Chloroflexota bacterium]
MAQAQKGDSVKVHYTGKLNDGTVFDSSSQREPLEFTLGEGQVIPGFENAVLGMESGESKTVTIPADQAYGQRRPDLLIEVEREQFPPHIEPEPGQQLQVQQSNGQMLVVVVSEVNTDSVTLDANHPLAGHDLTFDIQLVGVND